MNNKFNQLTICRHHYEDDTAFWTAVANMLQVLFDNDYLCCIRMEDNDVMVVEYNYADLSMGTPTPHWITDDEYWAIEREEDDD